MAALFLLLEDAEGLRAGAEGSAGTAAGAGFFCESAPKNFPPLIRVLGELG